MAVPNKPIDYAVLAHAEGEYQDQGALHEPQALVPEEAEVPKGESCDEVSPPQ